MTREDCILYAYDHGIPITATKEKVYSIDDNLWAARSSAARWRIRGACRHPACGRSQADGHRAARSRDRIEEGVPVTVDGRPTGPVELISEVGAAVGSFGWAGSTWSKIAGSGSRAAKPTSVPSALALIAAHSDLESITHERDLAREKQRLEIRYASSSTTASGSRRCGQALDAFIDEFATVRNGEVSPAPRARIVASSPVGAASTASYDYGLATYDAADVFGTRTRPASFGSGPRFCRRVGEAGE